MTHGVTFTPAQCRAARALLGLQQAELADLAQCARKTVADFEGGKTTPNHRTLGAIRGALETRGAVFVGANQPSVGGGPGVRLASGGPRAEET